MPLFYLSVRLAASALQQSGTRDSGEVVMWYSDREGNDCHFTGLQKLLQGVAQWRESD